MKCRKTVKTWATGFIKNLIRITHNQWTWRNEKLHFRRHPGAETVFEYEKNMQRIIDDLEMMNSEDLLPEDQYLLGVDPEDLETASKDRRQVCQAELDTAVAAAEHVTTRLNLPPKCKHEDVQAAHFKPNPTCRCVYEAGRCWYKAKKTKQIMRWKRYNFFEIEKSTRIALMMKDT